ncbi:CotH kinase family protein, partial [Balneolaceae bacterium ANBcel3]|nr:CotH kinase family protein [Balneolaceae bacterium ANBcel3]
ISGLNFDTQAYRPFIVFINGEYWGIQNLRERYDAFYFERTYGVDPDNIDHLSENMEIKSGDSLHFSALRQFVSEHSLAEEKHFEYVKTQMDLDNFLDYIVAQMFIRNVDWPGNNQDYWRLRVPYNPDAPAGHDGRWRWVVLDTDAAFGLLNPFRVESFNMLRHSTNDTYDEWPNYPWSTLLIRRLFENESFRNDFINRSADLMNTLFRPNHVISMIDKFEDMLEPVIEEHIKRWGQIDSKQQWHFNIQRMRDFAEKRPEYHTRHIRDFFDLGGTSEITVDVSSLKKGRIRINQITIDEETPGLQTPITPYPWKGAYFNNTPVTITALPYHGFSFSHWEADGLITNDSLDEESLTIVPSKNIRLKAIFTPDTSSTALMPPAHALAEGDYRFEEWDPDAEAGTYPSNMIFQYMDEEDPGLLSDVEGIVTGAYNLSSRTRINGLGRDGFSFINTSNPDGNPGFPGGRLGAAVLALNTLDMKDLRLNWTGGTVLPNSRVYRIRLQYRIHTTGPYKDVLDENGDPIEYKRNEEAGHAQSFTDISLPTALENKPYIELRWKYYFTGEIAQSDSGARSKLRISDIHVTGTSISEELKKEVRPLGSVVNYPNPFSHQTSLRLSLPEESLVSISIFDVNGRLIRQVYDQIRLRPGIHSIPLDSGNWASGVYIYRVETDQGTHHGKMTRIQ